MAAGVEPCHVHTWVSVATDKTIKVKLAPKRSRRVAITETRCAVCGIAQPPHKRVVRLVVLNRRVTCPYGWNEPDGTRNLHDCYLDSITPGHRCVDPEQTGAARCPHIATFHRRHGWRTFYRAMEVEEARYGVLHKEFPLRVLYSPLNQDGTRWMAVNQHTGQRVEVKLDGAGQRWTYDATTKRWTGLRTEATRLTPEGHPIELEHRITTVLNPGTPGTILHLAETEPYWLGVPAREDLRLCDCINCQEFRRTTGEIMSSTEFTHRTGVPFGMPQPPPPRPDAPAEKLAGDPLTCQDCRFARCRVHRMDFLPRTDAYGRRIIAHGGDWSKPNGGAVNTAAEVVRKRKLPVATATPMITKADLLTSKFKIHTKKRSR